MTPLKMGKTNNPIFYSLNSATMEEGREFTTMCKVTTYPHLRYFATVKKGACKSLESIILVHISSSLFSHPIFFLLALTHYHKGQHTYRKEDILMSGWLTKETSGGTLARPGANRKKRYFILTSNSLDYYRNVDLQQKLGAIALNSLCSVTVPDEKSMKEEGEWIQFGNRVIFSCWEFCPVL